MDTGKTYDADQLADGYRRYPIDDHGKLRMAYFSVAALTAALADGSTIGLLWLPPGRKRILPNLSLLTASAFGAARTLDVGHDAYMKRPPNETLEADDPNAFIAARDVSGATTAVAFGNAIKFDMYSTEEVLVYATVNGGTMPVGATLEGCIAYLYE